MSLETQNFTDVKKINCCYAKKYVDNYIILAFYIDDMLIVSANIAKIDRLKKQLSENLQ